MRAIQVATPGQAEVLEVAELEIPTPSSTQIQVRVSTAGVNFIDVHQRAGRYPVSTPFVPGLEGAGEITKIGDEVQEFEVGQRIAWKFAPASYAEYAVVDAWQAVPVPDDIPDEIAGGLLLQGCTAHFLVTSAYPVSAGETVLIHAAAGGVGQIATQIAKIHGARVIGSVGSVSTDEKERAAREAGVDEIVRNDGSTNLAAAVRELTDGQGVAAVFDGIGKDTFDASLDCIRPRGYLVVFGGASGPVEGFAVERLNTSGSIFLTRPSLGTYTSTQAELRARAHDLFDWLAAGRVAVHIGGRYPLDQVARAHAALEGRRTTGKLILDCK